MTEPAPPFSRRDFLAAAAARAAVPSARAAAKPQQAQVAITLDLEMSRQYPTRDQTHWDYEKGNLDLATKRYAVEAARRVKRQGGRIHFFAVGRVLEQADVGWLEELAREGHPIGNHTYDHIFVKATRLDQLQFRFQRAPWLLEGKTLEQAVSDNIRMTTRALRQRIGVEPAGFRTPGGFSDGLSDRPDVQTLLKQQGYNWVSSRYPAHPAPTPGIEPDAAYFQALIRAQIDAQPFAYPTGLVEVPMSPISDVNAFRTGRWKLDWFLEAIRRGVEWAIEQRAVFDLLAHPSCLVVEDPEFRTIELVSQLVRQSRDRAALVDLGTIARRALPS
jgi:peptidoglycan/xylan/chitin deacetylase (PgdA/CDA1 family)